MAPPSPLKLMRIAHSETGQPRMYRWPRAGHGPPGESEAGFHLWNARAADAVIPPLQGEVCDPGLAPGEPGGVASTTSSGGIPHPIAARFATGDRPPPFRGRYNRVRGKAGESYPLPVTEFAMAYLQIIVNGV